MKGIYERAQTLNDPGLNTFEEDGIILGDKEDTEPLESQPAPFQQVQHPFPITPPQPIQHSMQTRSMADQAGVQTRSSSKLKVAVVEQVKPPKRPVVTDDTHKVTGNTTVTPIVIKDDIMFLEN